MIFNDLQNPTFQRYVKFGYSEKVTKYEKIFHLKFDATE